MIKNFKLALATALVFPATIANADSHSSGLEAIRKMQGCYLIDYSYAETAPIKAGYQPDSRIYDVNKDKSVKELIYAIETSPTQIRLQHILFATDLSGKLMEGSELRHQAEDWHYNSPFLYEFVAPSKWQVRETRDLANAWTRKITNLDDGLRYQCAAPWSTDKANPEWTCANYSPIPGRETRDMGRKDYNTLDRKTRIVVYNGSWLERQNNIKTTHSPEGVREQLVNEEGKNWYVRLPDSECDPVRNFVNERSEFWTLLQQTWDEVFAAGVPFTEKTLPGQMPRYAKMMQVEARYIGQDLSAASTRATAKKEILEIIEIYRAR